ncbi:hypothetical protein RB595_007383 [Gaeumannomyces hyphopodioides]
MDRRSSGADARALVLLNDQKIPCPECNVVLASPGALFEHKEDMMSTTGTHLDCVICKITFHTPNAYRLHYRLSHIAKQRLQCPGCKATFVRGAGLLAHLEQGHCDHLGEAAKTYTNAKREQTIGFIRALQDRDIVARAGFQLGPGKTGDDYGGYVGKRRVAYELTDDEVVRFSLLHLGQEDNESKGASFNHEVDFPPPGAGGYHHGDSKQPDLLGDEGSVVHNQPDKGAWDAGSKQLFPNATAAAPPPPTRLTPQGLLSLLEQVDKRMPRAEHDPEAPGFDAGRYWAEVLNKFKCPHPRCGKSFKARNGLIGHLQSDAHRSAPFICPQCMRKFGSITALAQHAEAEGIRCTVQTSESYRIFLAQLTGSVLDVDGSNDDRSPMYVVTDQAKCDLSDGVEGVLRALNASRRTQQAPQPTLAAARPKLLTARDHHEKFCEDYRKEMAEKHGAHVGHASDGQW